MSSQLPTGYENYPRPDEPGKFSEPNGWESPPPPAPIVVSQRRRPTPGTAATSTTRRTLLAGGAAFVGVVAAAGMIRWGTSSATPTSTGSVFDETYDDPFDSGSDEQVDTEVLMLGQRGLDVPAGWTVAADTEARALLTRGHNRVLLVSYEPGGSEVAEELTSAIGRSDAGFSGPESRIVATTDTLFERAVLTSTGTYQGRAARQIAEVLISEDGASALFIEQILTADKSSAIAKESSRLVADVRDSWPW